MLLITPEKLSGPAGTIPRRFA